MLVITRAGIPKKLVRKGYREDPDLTAPSKAVWSGSAAAQFVKALFGWQLASKHLEHLLLYTMSCTTLWSYYPPSLDFTFYVLKVANIVFKP